MYLAAAGVGEIGLVDHDRVDPSNLHRQVLYSSGDPGRVKVEVAAEKLQSLNPHVRVQAHAVPFSGENARDLVAAHDIVVDGTDTFATRYLVNDACVLERRPNVYASVLKFSGQLSVFSTESGPCYRCVFPEPPAPGTVPSCAEAGVLGVVPGLLGLLQASETIKLLTGLGSPMVGRLLLVDVLGMRFREVSVHRDPRCPACGTRTMTELGDYAAFCGHAPGSKSGMIGALTPRELARWKSEGRPVTLIDVREEWERALVSLPEARLIPLGTLLRELDEIPRSRPVVLYCHHGARSMAAAQALNARGFTEVWNLEGGIDRYAREVDPTLPRY
jgi:adenylyltransferase/sulfurtransferase